MRGVRRLARMVNAFGDALQLGGYSSSLDAELVADFNRALVKAVTEHEDGMMSLLDPDYLHEQLESQRLANEERRRKSAEKEGG